jgi:hypothetical protein
VAVLGRVRVRVRGFEGREGKGEERRSTIRRSNPKRKNSPFISLHEKLHIINFGDTLSTVS